METRNSIYFKNYERRAKDPQSWFRAGLRNQRIGDFLLRKYNSYYRRLKQWGEESITAEFPKKKRRLNDKDNDLHRYILMFFGYAVENYLKGCLIKKNLLVNVTSLNKNNILCLNKNIKNHNLVAHYKNIFKNTEFEGEEINTLEDLQRAIESGKYAIESCANNSSPYTADLDKKIRISKKIIKQLKRLFNKS